MIEQPWDSDIVAVMIETVAFVVTLLLSMVSAVYASHEKIVAVSAACYYVSMVFYVIRAWR